MWHLHHHHRYRSQSRLQGGVSHHLLRATSSTPTLDYEVNLYESGTPAFDYTYGLVTTFSATGRFLTVGVEQNTTLFTGTGVIPQVGRARRSVPVSN